MNAGLSNLATLKAWLLPSGMLDGTDFDTQIAAIGKGVALQLEEACNRKFARTVGDTFECQADRMHVVLPRAPVVPTPTVHLRDDLATGYVAQTYNDLVIDHDLGSGLIKFSTIAGPSTSRLKFTYTGGYFWEQLEPADEDYPTAVPDGATAVPDNLMLAWRLQCEFIWGQRDKLGLSIGETPDKIYAGALPKVRLMDGVLELLRPFVRHTLT